MKRSIILALCLLMLAGCRSDAVTQNPSVTQTTEISSLHTETANDPASSVKEYTSLSSEPNGFKYGELIISPELEYELVYDSVCIDDVRITAQRNDGQDYSAQTILEECIDEYDALGCDIINSELKTVNIGGTESIAACITANVDVSDEAILSYCEYVALETEHYVYIFNYGYWGENIPDISHIYNGIILSPYSDDYFMFDDDYADLIVSNINEEPRTLIFDGGLSFEVAFNSVLEYASDSCKKYSYNGSYEYLEVDIFADCEDETVSSFTELDLLQYYSEPEKWSDLRRINVNGFDVVCFVSDGQRCFLLQNGSTCYCIKMRMFQNMMLETLTISDCERYEFNDSIDDLVEFGDYPEDSYEYFNDKVGVSCPEQFEFSLSNNTLYCNEWGGRYRTARCQITSVDVKDFYHMDIADFKRYYSTCTAMRRTNIDGYDTILLEYHSDTIYSLEALVRISDNEYYRVYTEYHKDEHKEYVDTWGANAILADAFLGNAQRFIGSIRIKE